ncbi:MAG: hypothetical protein HKP25_14430 [Marinicaulis sp.]|nr:hypothetical protein [Marinicaulis sp.]
MRIFHEGFAVRLTEPSIALIAHAKATIPELKFKPPQSARRAADDAPARKRSGAAPQPSG